MKHEIDLKDFKIRTDLINENLEKITNKDGIEINNYKEKDIEIEKVIVNKEASIRENIKEGTYISLLFEDVSDTKNRKDLEEVFTKVFRSFLEEKGLTKDKSCLIIGLGNKEATADALGPKVIDEVLVTRYIASLSTLDNKYRITSSFAPGVFGTSGVESYDIILKLKEIVKPDFIILIDALKAMNLNRINKTIQITDVGITPGSGVSNKNKEISLNTINIPVIVIGVPTVIEASIIVSDTIKFLYKKLSYSKENIDNPTSKFTYFKDINYLEKDSKELSKEEKEKVLGLIGSLNEEDVKQLIYEVLEPIGYNLIVTEKEIDFTIKNLVKVISYSINHSLHDLDNN